MKLIISISQDEDNNPIDDISPMEEPLIDDSEDDTEDTENNSDKELSL